MAVRVIVGRLGPKHGCSFGWCRSAQSEFECLGCYPTPKKLFTEARRGKAQVIVLDSDDGMDRIAEWIPDLREVGHGLGMMLLSSRLKGAAVLEAVLEGVRGCLIKPASLQTIEAAVRTVSAQGTVLSHEAASLLVAALNECGGTGGAKVSPRQRQILSRRALGQTNKEIAIELGVKNGTVYSQLRRLERKSAGELAKVRLNQVRHDFDASAGPWSPRTLQELQAAFGTESDCRDYLADLRWGHRFHCPNCKGESSWSIVRNLRSCAKCRHQISVTAGTHLHGTRIALRAWFRAVWEVAASRGAISASEVARLTNLGSYKGGWMCTRKIKQVLRDLTMKVESETLETGELFRGLLKLLVQIPPRGSRRPHY